MRRVRHAKIVAIFALRPSGIAAIAAGMPFRTPGTINMLESERPAFMRPVGGGGEA